MSTRKKSKGGSKGCGRGATTTRSAAVLFDFSTEFPAMKQFTPSNKLPDFRSLVGVLRNILEVEGRGITTSEAAIREVGKQILAKWFHDNVYHKSLNSICKMVAKVHSTYVEGKRRLGQGRLNSKAYELFVELYQKKLKLFDVYPEEQTRIMKCQEEWGGLRMTDRDRDYYQDQKGARLMVCEKRCDLVFSQIWLKEQRKQEANERWQQEKKDMFRFRSLKDIKRLLIERGDYVTDSEE